MSAQTSAQSASTTSTATNEEPVSLERFVVTGSAIPVEKGKEFMRIRSFEQTDFTDLGVANVAEGLRTLPDFFGSMSTELRSNGGTGSAGSNLRGLGGVLTLLDGHRTAGFDELNLLPLIAVEKVEVLTDGAAARYGADALTGVVNPQLVKSYRGQKLQSYYGNTQFTDAAVVRIGALGGYGNAHTEIVAAAEYYSRNALMARDRAVTADADVRSLGGLNRRESTVSGEVFSARPGDAAYAWLLPVADVAFQATTTAMTPYNSAQHALNVRSITPTTAEQENRSAYVRIEQHLLADGRLDIFARYLYSENTYEGGVLSATVGLPYSAIIASPHRPTGLLIPNYSAAPTTVISYVRPEALGGRGRTYSRRAYDFQAGLKGRLPGEWSWAATYLYGWWNRNDVQSNLINNSALLAAVTSGAYNPFAVDAASGINPNNGRGYDNPEALRAAASSAQVNRDFGLRGADAHIGGPLVKLPAGAVELAVGGDFTLVEDNSAPDAVVLAGTAAYAGLSTSSASAASYQMKGAFAEVVVPLVSPSQHVPLVHAFKITAGVRRTEKEVTGTQPGNVNLRLSRAFDSVDPKLAVRYELTRELALRASYGRGFRTPALSYLFAGPFTRATAISDPLGYPITATVPVSGQGEMNLKPEKSVTHSAGIQYDSRKLRGLSVMVDYFHDELSDMVVDGPQFMVNANAASGGVLYADRITRNTAGSITAINSTPVNAASREASGLSYTLAYDWKTAAQAHWNARIQAVTTLDWDLTAIKGSPSQNWLGKYVDPVSNPISPGSIPRHRGKFTLAREQGCWSALGAINYVAHLEDDRALTAGKAFRYISSWTTVDLQLSYRPQVRGAWTILRGVDLRVGVNNVANRAAPFAAGALSDNYDYSLHNVRGRFFYTQLTKAF